MNHLLSCLIFLPALGAVAVLLSRNGESARRIAAATTLLTLFLSVLLLVRFDWRLAGSYGYASNHGVVQLVERADWIASLRVNYRVGVDGLSLPLVLLTTVVSAIACFASERIVSMRRGYFALLLFLESGMLGTFLSLDLFLFYVFFEVSLFPMYFLIGIWGGTRREYAAIKFFLYTLAGSICLLIAIIAIFVHAGSFDMIELPGILAAKCGDGTAMALLGRVLFILLLVAFFVKIPAVPLHTWLPDAHVEAPTPVSMILAAILLKMGGYGILRIAYPFFPDAARHLWLLVGVIGVVSIIYGALCAMAQTDFKRLVAYSSVSHMGFVTLGAAMMTPSATNGAIFMMVAHGIISAMMFFIVGVAYDRAGHREIARLGGLAAAMPRYWGLSTVGFFANLGLPGLCGFVGEVMVLLGTFQAARADSILRADQHASRITLCTLAIIASVGIVLTAGYMLWTMQRVFLGPVRGDAAAYPEIGVRETTILSVFGGLAILLGVLPGVLFSLTNRTSNAMLGLLQQHGKPISVSAAPDGEAAGVGP